MPTLQRRKLPLSCGLQKKSIGGERRNIVEGNSENEKARADVLSRNEIESKLRRNYGADGSAMELRCSKQDMGRQELPEAGLKSIHFNHKYIHGKRRFTEFHLTRLTLQHFSPLKHSVIYAYHVI